MSKTFDLSTLNLSAGAYEITVKARANGYEDSVASNVVSYTVAGEEITFTIAGTSYQAVDGMTWGEWVESEYNTGVEEGGTILTYFVDIHGGSYIGGTNEEIPIGAILRSGHAGGGYVVRLNGVCVLNTDTIMPTAYEEVGALRN